MHMRLEASLIVERSLAFGRRKATFAGPGPQPTMLPWFQRSMHVRNDCSTFGLWPPQLSSAPVSRKETVEALPAEPAIRIFVMDCLPDRGLDQPAGVEAELELEQRIVRAADAAAEVEALVAVRLRPSGCLEEEQVVGAAASLGGAEVVVEPRRAREAEQRGAQAACGQRLEEHKPGAVRKRPPGLLGEVV